MGTKKGSRRLRASDPSASPVKRSYSCRLLPTTAENLAVKAREAGFGEYVSQYVAKVIGLALPALRRRAVTSKSGRKVAKSSRTERVSVNFLLPESDMKEMHLHAVRLGYPRYSDLIEEVFLEALRQ